MAVTSRLNRVIATLEAGQRVFAAFASADPAAAVELSTRPTTTMNSAKLWVRGVLQEASFVRG